MEEKKLRGRISNVEIKLGNPLEQRTRFTLHEEEVSLIGIIPLFNSDYIIMTKGTDNSNGRETVSYDIEKLENGLPEGDVIATYHQDYILKELLI